MKNEIKTTHELSVIIAQTIHKVKNEVIRKYENNVRLGLVPKSYSTLSAFENICITKDLVIEVLMKRYDFDIFCDYEKGKVIDLRMLRLPCGDFIIKVYVSLTVEICKELIGIDKEQDRLYRRGDMPHSLKYCMDNILERMKNEGLSGAAQKDKKVEISKELNDVITNLEDCIDDIYNEVDEAYEDLLLRVSLRTDDGIYVCPEVKYFNDKFNNLGDAIQNLKSELANNIKIKG